MQKIHLVIANCGDGSSTIEWYKDSITPMSKLEEMERDDPERYAGGDGLQVKTLEFPYWFNIDSIGHIYWCDDDNG